LLEETVYIINKWSSLCLLFELKLHTFKQNISTLAFDFLLRRNLLTSNFASSVALYVLQAVNITTKDKRDCPA
jgi:hypothetical protein